MPAQPGPNVFFFDDYRPEKSFGDNFAQMEYVAHLDFDKDPEGKDFITIDHITCVVDGNVFNIDDLFEDGSMEPKIFDAIFDYAAHLFIPYDSD